jgi:hypothetical protein
MQLKRINDSTPHDRMIVLANVLDSPNGNGLNTVLMNLDFGYYDDSVDDLVEIQVLFWRDRFGRRISFTPSHWCEMPMVEIQPPGAGMRAFVGVS